MTRVLVLSNEPVGEAMAGPAIRTCELARALAGAGHDVTLAAPGSPALAGAPFAVAAAGDRESVRRLTRDADVALVQGWVLERYPSLAQGDARLAVDPYDPFGLELLVLLGSTTTRASPCASEG